MPKDGCLTTSELTQAANYWYSVIQKQHFNNEMSILKSNRARIPSSSKLLSLNPIVDDYGILRVGGRQQNSRFSYNSRHPVIVDSKHPLTKLLIKSEHVRLLHGGSLLVSASLFRDFHIIGGHRTIRSIVRSCVVCRRRAPKPRPQMMGQLPVERITPDIVFEHVGLDYAGPLYLKRGPTSKPIILKSYVCVFVSMSVKAVHLELALHRILYRLLEKIHRQERETFIHLERPRYQLCGCQSCYQGALCIPTLQESRRDCL